MARVYPLAYTITSGCIDVMDRSCLEACPVDCIHAEDGRDRMLFIDPHECIGCGACVESCPVGAIFPVDDVPPEEHHFIEINRTYFKRRGAARRAVDAHAAEARGERTGT